MDHTFPDPNPTMNYPSTATPTGSAERWGPLWGHRPDDWAAGEDRQRPTYEEAIRRLDLRPGQRVLDIGCGSGAFLALAAGRGAHVCGLDASDALLERARDRVPAAELLQGDMNALPFADDTFDVVTGFNAFFFAQDMAGALREAARVARGRGSVLIQVFGPPERCDLEAAKAVIRPFLPPPPPGAAAAPELWRPGALEAAATAAGLTPASTFDVRYTMDYADAETLGRLLVAPAGVARLAGPEREPRLRAAIVAALASRRRDDGSYRLTNESHCLVATAP
ncbi:MAG TPA: class I SAM-dependent methyltransferase [Baekduia sp.]|nr:class I SAM-dependent methyltransferase [Baekduia sp.]